MANFVAAVRDVNEAASGVALADPPAAMSSARPALQDVGISVRGPYGRYLPQVLDVAGAKTADGGEVLPEIGAALSFSAVDEVAVNHGAISGIVVSRDGRRLIVANYGDNSVTVIDTCAAAVVNTVTGTDEPFAIALGGPNDNCSYVTTVSPAYDAISVIDMTTNTVIATHPMAMSVTDLVVSPDGKRVYAGRTGIAGADVAVLDTTTGRVNVIDLADLVAVSDTTVECLDISPDGGRLYVGTQRPSGGEVVVIDAHAQEVIDAVEVDCPIRDVVVSPDGSTVCVGSCDPDLGGVVNMIDTRANRITARIEIGGLLTQLALSGDGERAFVVNGDYVTVLCMLTHEVIDAITVSAQPSCVVESPDGKHLYVADYSGAVTVVSIVSTTASLVAQIVRNDVVGKHRMPQLKPVG